MNVELSEFSKSVTKWLIENAISKIDVETIQKVFQYGIDKLKELAAGTTTPIDDWAIGELEEYLKDSAKVELIRAFIVSKLNKLCATPAGIDSYTALADSLIECHEGCCGTPEGNRSIAFILNWIIMSIVEYFTNTKED